MYSLKHLVSIHSLSRQQILWLLDEGIGMIPYAARWQRPKGIFRLEEDQMAPGSITIMLQPSTGTAVSFDAASNLLGCSNPTQGIRDASVTSMKKQERLRHFCRRLYLQAGVRFFAIRSPIAGLTAALAFDFDRQHLGQTMLKNNVSFINCGEGERYHPSQILLDLLSMAVWSLFGEEIKKDGASRLSYPQLLAAVAQFCQLPENERREKIAQTIDGKTICFAGDMNSRVLFDWLSVGRRDEKGKKMFDLRYIFIAPDFAQVEGRYLQGLDFQTDDNLHPDLPADWFYRLRWRKEDREVQFHDLIARYDAMYRVTLPFLDRLTKRNPPAFFLDALPIDKWNPSIEDPAEDHPNSLCWLQAWCALPTRLAILKVAYCHWQDEAAVAESSWQLPKPMPAPLNTIESESLAEHQRRYFEEKVGAKEDSVKLQNYGCNLDHLPPGKSVLFKRILRAQGFQGQILSSDNVLPRHGQGPPRDIMWFPKVRLDEWNPQILAVFSLLAGGRLTYNIFDSRYDLFCKQTVGVGSRMVGILRCPSGINPRGLPPTCIDGHQEEIATTSITDLFGSPDRQFARCFYCGSLHTDSEMSVRLLQSLPD